MKDLIKNRTKKFALDCWKICTKLPHSREFNAYVNQLIRSSSSVGANYRAALRGKSNPDFLNKIKIVEEEADEHQFFFEWTDGVFSNPTGNGNIDNKSDPVNYGSSVDSNGLPLGLTTSWTTSTTATTGTKSFRILLKHQPEIKSATSTSADGESDLDLSFTISIL